MRRNLDQPTASHLSRSQERPAPFEAVRGDDPIDLATSGAEVLGLLQNSPTISQLFSYSFLMFPYFCLICFLLLPISFRISICFPYFFLCFVYIINLLFPYYSHFFHLFCFPLFPQYSTGKYLRHLEADAQTHTHIDNHRYTCIIYNIIFTSYMMYIYIYIYTYACLVILYIQLSYTCIIMYTYRC